MKLWELIIKYRKLIIVSGLSLTVGICTCGVLFIVLLLSSIDTSGSSKLAQQWADELSSLSGPDDKNITPDSQIEAIEFPNGEWLIGRVQSSHGLRTGAGTFVVRDSRGNTRAFFGHVCGALYLRRCVGGFLRLRGTDAGDGDLTKFYEYLVKEAEFTEFQLKPVLPKN